MHVLEARLELKERLELECYKRGYVMDIDDELLDIIIAVMADAELYDLLLRLDI